MILWFTNKKIKNTQSQVFEEITDSKIPPVADLAVAPLQQSIVAFFAPNEQPTTSCAYPMRVEELFPYWLRQNVQGSSNLLLMTKKYYDWLSCGMSENSVSFLNLEDLIDIETIPDELLKHQLFSYVNSFPVENIKTADNPNGNVDPAGVRKLFDNVKINLYTKKGTEESFKLVLENLFGIPANKVSISYPKRYVMRLNGGRFDWMRDDNSKSEPYTNNKSSYNPQLVGSYLNHSILQDNNLWQEYSYVLNISGLSADAYQSTVRPLVHPAGTKDFYNVRQDIFNNIFNSTGVVKYEIPTIKNYAVYNLLDSETINCALGCSGGTDNPGYPFEFPSWDDEISAKYYTGMTFGMINIGDFIRLSSADGNYPNDGVTCGGCI
jgi:hypothetical protein